MPVQPVPITSDQFQLLSHVIRAVARSHRLGVEDAEDFGQVVHLHLLERNYEVFQAFEGRSSLQTYLTVVVTRLLLDWRNATRGKWRPSAVAVRLGPDAVTLERLVHRDGLPVREAIQVMVSRHADGHDAAAARLEALAASLPARVRRTFVPAEASESARRTEFVDPVAHRESLGLERAVRAALRQACASLPPEERQLIALRFGRELTVQTIGRRLGTDPKPLYRRLARSLGSLRRALEASGVERDRAAGKSTSRSVTRVATKDLR